jgi:hypothetical protein
MQKSFEQAERYRKSAEYGILGTQALAAGSLWAYREIQESVQGFEA